MDSAAKKSILSEHLSERLGGLILKDEQKLAVEALMSGKDVLAVLPTSFGKSVIYQSFVIALLCSSQKTHTIAYIFRKTLSWSLLSQNSILHSKLI